MQIEIEYMDGKKEQYPSDRIIYYRRSRGSWEKLKELQQRNEIDLGRLTYLLEKGLPILIMKEKELTAREDNIEKIINISNVRNIRIVK